MKFTFRLSLCTPHPAAFAIGQHAVVQAYANGLVARTTELQAEAAELLATQRLFGTDSDAAELPELEDAAVAAELKATLWRTHADFAAQRAAWLTADFFDVRHTPHGRIRVLVGLCLRHAVVQCASLNSCLLVRSAHILMTLLGLWLYTAEMDLQRRQRFVPTPPKPFTANAGGRGGDGRSD